MPDSANPKNWPARKRWTATLLASLFMLVSPVASSIVAPVLSLLQREFRISTAFETQMVLSVFILSSAVGPLVISPLSEVYGRRIVLHLTMLAFLIFNLACAFCRTGTQPLILRFLAGIGGSAPAIGPGILGDCWRPEERGKGLGLYYILALLGPSLGPIFGGFIVRHLDWRWIFYSTSILSVVIQVIGLPFLPEMYPLVILGHKKRNKQHTCGANFSKSSRAILLQALVRPLRLLGTQVIVQAMAVYLAYVYGLLYLALSTYVLVWTDVYKQSVEIATLNYLSLALGFTVCTQIMAPVSDLIYSYLKSRNGGIGLPVHRAPILIPGAFLVPMGFLLYGWSAQKVSFWLVPNIGAAILGGGIIVSMQSITSYVVDVYPLYAASATAALTLLRAIAGFTIVISWPAPLVLWKYGGALRARSRYATNDVE
ncbi:major facilitator superfamily domain-containing protein [Corynascus similis CBS 632.67]